MKVYINGTTVDVSFKDPGTVERMMWMARMPESMRRSLDDPESIEITEEVIQYYRDLITGLSDIDGEVLDEVDLEDFGRLMKRASEKISDNDNDEPTLGPEDIL